MPVRSSNNIALLSNKWRGRASTLECQQQALGTRSTGAPLSRPIIRLAALSSPRSVGWGAKPDAGAGVGAHVGSSGESRCVKIPCFQPARFSLHSHDLLQGIRGLSRPAGCPQVAGEPLHPERGARQSHRAGAELHGRGAQPRRPHQRRGARDSGGLLRRDAQERRQLRGDVQEGQGRAGEEIQGGVMRLSREKLNKLASTTTEMLAGMKNVEFLEGYDDIRQEIRRLLEELLAGEEKLDKAARQKIESQRRIILEGTPEWSILYHKYYNEEVKKLGII